MADKEKLRRVITHEVGHYIAFRELDIVPNRIEIYFIPDAIVEDDHTEDGIIGLTLIPSDNFFFDDIKDCSKYSFAQCVSLAAGTFSEFLNFSTKEIGKCSAAESFMKSNLCEKDSLAFMEHLPYYIASNIDEFGGVPGETNQKIAITMIFNKVCEIFIGNAEIIEKLTDFLFSKVVAGQKVINNSEINSLPYILNKYENIDSGIFVTTAETISRKLL